MKTNLLPLASVLAISAALLLASPGVIAAGIAFTVACVPTGMKTGVGTAA